MKPEVTNMRIPAIPVELETASPEELGGDARGFGRKGGSGDGLDCEPVRFQESG